MKMFAWKVFNLLVLLFGNLLLILISIMNQGPRAVMVEAVLLVFFFELYLIHLSVKKFRFLFNTTLIYKFNA